MPLLNKLAHVNMHTEAAEPDEAAEEDEGAIRSATSIAQRFAAKRATVARPGHGTRCKATV